MLVTLIGLGGGAGTVTAEARTALEQADAVLGAARLLAALDMPDGASDPASVRVSATVPQFAEVRPAVIAELIAKNDWALPCVLYSGDTGFHSGAAGLVPLLEARGIPFRVLPGLSSIQLLAARLGRPWQGWRPATAHGVPCDPVSELCHGVPVFFLTGPGRPDGSGGPAALCAKLAEAGLEDLPVTIGENLSLPGERVTRTTAGAAARMTFAPLSVLLAEAAPFPGSPVPFPGGSGSPDAAASRSSRTPGIPDSLFLRGDVPMTKQIVRAAALALLAVRPGDTLWDIGAGTGSVSVELALAARGGRVYAVERRAAARDLILANRTRFGAWNLVLAGYEAPAALDFLPAPDGVFIGGTGGRLAAVLDAVLDRNPAVRLCVSAVTAETLAEAMELLSACGLDPEAVQVSVSRTGIGIGKQNLHLFRAENPVFLVAAGGGGTVESPCASTAVHP